MIDTIPLENNGNGGCADNNDTGTKWSGIDSGDAPPGTTRITMRMRGNGIQRGSCDGGNKKK